jgi:hypothetical protein
MMAELSTQIELSDLPEKLQEINGIVGLEATLTIVKHYGGVRLYVPMTMTPDHILARLIGFDAAVKMAKEFGGMDHFDIPRAADALRAVRNREILDKYTKGKSLRLLAIEYQMTERSILKILAANTVKHEIRQTRLF